jgi:hypothetical protein
MTRLPRLATLLAIASIAVAVAVAGFALFGDPRFTLPVELQTLGFYGIVILFPVVGALIIQRRPSTRVAWLMIGLGLALGLGLVTFAYGINGMPPAAPLPFAIEMLVISSLFFVPAIGGGTILILLLFPTDRFLSPRWRWAAYIGLAGVALDLAGALLRVELDPETFPGVLNPIGAPPEWAELLEVVFVVANLLVTAGLLLAVVSLVVRYRRAGPVESAQIRWLALVGVLVAATLVLTIAGLGPISDLGFGLALTLIACMPIAIGIAITRYRLYDIDRLINRALVYGSLTAILAGTFTAAVGLAQRIFVAATNETSDAALVGATLVIATLYAPLRKRLEAIIDRRFKFEEARFGAYRDELSKHLALTDPQRAWQRLVDEAVRQLDAVGGAVLDAGGQVLAQAGTWPADPVVRIPLAAGKAEPVTLALGSRQGGREHDPRHVEALTEVATLAATSIRQASLGTVSRR